MNKKTILVAFAVAVFVLLGAGYYYWKTSTREAPKSAAEQALDDLQQTAAGVSADVGSSVAPDVTTPNVNPITTDTNPYNKTNPFSGLKTNPFQ
ncbi:MAG: hypothetical protein Q7R85_04150 [bacterium]|nr:hypothetical protein [bacterium]